MVISSDPPSVKSILLMFAWQLELIFNSVNKRYNLKEIGAPQDIYFYQ